MCVTDWPSVFAVCCRSSGCVTWSCRSSGSSSRRCLNKSDCDNSERTHTTRRPNCDGSGPSGAKWSRNASATVNWVSVTFVKFSILEVTVMSWLQQRGTSYQQQPGICDWLETGNRSGWKWEKLHEMRRRNKHDGKFKRIVMFCLCIFKDKLQGFPFHIFLEEHLVAIKGAAS